jgi:hypothetical protein
MSITHGRLGVKERTGRWQATRTGRRHARWNPGKTSAARFTPVSRKRSLPSPAEPGARLRA